MGRVAMIGGLVAVALSGIGCMGAQKEVDAIGKSEAAAPTGSIQAEVEDVPEMEMEEGGIVDAMVGSAEPAAEAPRPRMAKRMSARAVGSARVGDAYATGGSTLGMAPPPPSEAFDVSMGNTEEFTDHGVQDMVRTSADAKSTFAVDVDTASYAMSRRMIREGQLPREAAVRVEEFVNYFPYSYAQPRGDDPFAVDVEAAPSPFSEGRHLVRVGVQGRDVSASERKPMNLTFLVDVSGSMGTSDKLGLLRDTLKMLTNELDGRDTVALVTYAGATRVVLKPTPMSERQVILDAMDRLQSGGGTAMGAGIQLAYEQAEAAFQPGAVNRVIVASDGDANVGVVSQSTMSEYIGDFAKRGITLTTLGFGRGNYKDTRMEQLANKGDGNYYYIDSLQESRRLFVDKLSSTMEVIAKDVKIQVEWNEKAVEQYRLIGYENRDIADRDFRNDKVDAGEIGAGHQVTALYEVVLADSPQGELATVRIRNKAPGVDSAAVEREYTMPQSIMASSFGGASDQFRLQTAVVGFAEILRGSRYIDRDQIGQVIEIASDARRRDVPEDAELIQLMSTAQSYMRRTLASDGR